MIASGGISAIEDLVVLAEAAAAGANLEGSIVSKAFYAGRFNLPEALEAIRRTGRRPLPGAQIVQSTSRPGASANASG